MAIRVRAHWSALLPVAFATLACSDPAHPPISPKDDDGSGSVAGNTMVASSRDAGDATVPPGGCTNLMPAPEVKGTFSSLPQPAPLGGTIADGTYHVSSLVIYGPPNKTVYSNTERYKFAGSKYEEASQTEMVITRTSGSYALHPGEGDGGAAVGPTIEFMEGCPMVADGKAPYTATPGKIIFYNYDKEITYVPD